MSENNKVVIVTGASGGIGKAIALAFGKQQANVVVHYNKNEEAAQDIVKMIERFGGKAIALSADIRKYEDAKDLVEKTINHFGSIDVLVNNSGITDDQLMLRMEESSFDNVIDVNLKGTWNMCKHVTRPMLKQKSGRIINITSVVGLTGNAGQANYVASKSGVIGLTKSLAKEFGKKQVTVNAVAPGFIETSLTEALPEAIKNAYLKQIPLNRFGKTDDVANIVSFLASDQASYITGQIISVNGGMI